MEIMTTWNSEFEFDLQRFADDPVTSAKSTSAQLLLDEVKALNPSNGNVIYLDGTTLKSAATAPAGTTKLATYTAATTQLALESTVTSVVQGTTNDVNYKIVAATGTTVTLSQGTASVAFQGTKYAQIDASKAALTVKTTDADPAVITGTVVITPADINADVSASGASVSYGTDIGNSTTIKVSDGVSITTDKLKAGVSIDSTGEVSGTFGTGDKVSANNVLATATAGAAGMSVTFTKDGVSSAVAPGTGVFNLTGNKGGAFGDGIVAVTGTAADVKVASAGASLITGKFSAVKAGTAVDATGAAVIITGADKTTAALTFAAGADGIYTSNTDIKLTVGSVDVSKSVGTITIGDASLQRAYTLVTDSTFAVETGTTKFGLQTGTVTTTDFVQGVATITAEDSVEVKTNVNGVRVTMAAGAATTVSGMTDKEVVVLYDKSATTYYKYEATGLLVREYTSADGSTWSTTPTYYVASSATKLDEAVFAGSTAATGVTVSTASANINVNDVSTSTVHYYMSNGAEVPQGSGEVLTIDNTGSTAKVTATAEMSPTTITVDKAATVTDSSAASKFIVDGVSLKGAGFSVSNDKVVSDANGTLTLVSDPVKGLTASGAVSLDASVATKDKTIVTYVAGTGFNDVSVKFASGNTMKISESSNATDTVVKTATISGKVEGVVEGLDDGAVVTGAVDGATLKTAGSGTFSINGKSWVVTGDDDGVTFTVDVDQTGQVGAITDLAKDATVAISDKLSDVKLLTVGATKFTDLTAKSGATFTIVDSALNSTVTLFAKGDTVKTTTIANGIEVVAMGSASDGVVIGDNTLGALNDGDKVKVFTGTDTYYLYEVSGNTMVVSDYTTAGGKFKSSTTYTLSDSSDSGFTVGIANAGTKINGDKGVDTETVTFGTGTDTQTATSLTDGIYVNADGTTTTSDKKAVAKVSIDNDVVTYTSMSSKGQTVNVTKGSDNWAITTGAGKDTIKYAGNGDASIDAGGGNDEITLSGIGDKVVNTGDGKNSVTIAGSGDVNLTLGNGKDTVTDAGSTGDVVVTATGGNNEIDMSGKGTKGDVTIIGGSGNDTITASSEDDAVSGGSGKDTFNITKKDVTISDYTFGDDVLQVSTTNATNVTPGMLSADGKVSVSNGGTADISANAGDFYAATLVDVNGKNAVNVGWAKEGGSNINTTSFSKDVLVKGDADGVNTLYTGAGDDFIYSYADNDSIYGGEGKDSIILKTNGEGRVVGIATNSSKDVVTGFTAGFSDSDSIFMVDGDVSGVDTTLESVSGGKGTFTFKDGAASLTLGSVGVNTVTGAAEILVNGFKLAALETGATAKVDDASYADIYMGDKSTVDFSAVDGDLFVDLSNGLSGSSAGAKYVGVNAVTGGNGNSTLMGTGSADYIVATSGKTSLFGGAGSDTLVGSKDSADVFFFGDGTGKNTITGFTTQGNENADTLQVYSNITGAKLNGSNVEISTADGSKAILTSQNANSKINVASTGFTGVAKVGSASSANNFTYDNDVTYYGGGNKSDKIAFASGYTDNAEIWMNGSQGKSYASIDVVDGTNTSGSLIVAGDSASQSIIGGKGDTSLWGGAGSATDTLKSSAGSKTMFWWGAGDGNDVVVSASADDSVNLYNVKLSDIDGANSSITNSGVVLALNDGSKLTMQTNRGMTFSIEGQSWTADQSSKEWKQNS